MSRHANAEQLASLDLDALKARKAAKIRTHVAGCVQCTNLSSQVSAVPATLASVSYPSMPASLSAQIDTALASESAQRLASAPATEAGRRDLPDRRNAGKQRSGWHLPGFSVLSTRLVAAAGALVIVGIGGYEIATHAGGNVSGTAASSSGTAAAPGVGQVSLGPDLRYGPTHTKTVPTMNAATNFTQANLGAEAVAALRMAKLKEPTGTHATGAPAPTANANSAAGGVAGAQVPSQANLSNCLDRIVGSQPVQLVVTARFAGKPATIIITAPTASRSAEVWAVGSACSASNPDVLDHLRLSST